MTLAQPIDEVVVEEDSATLEFPVSEIESLPSVDFDAEAIAAYEAAEAEDAWHALLDHVELEAAYKATQPPGGYYEVVNLTGRKSERETEFWVANGHGYEKVKRPRTQIRYSGRGIREVEGKVWQPFLSFNISPVRGYGKNADGSVNPDKFDSSYKLFCRAFFAYKEIVGMVPPNGLAIDTYLQSYPFRIQTMASRDSGGLIVLDIQGIKPV